MLLLLVLVFCILVHLCLGYFKSRQDRSSVRRDEEKVLAQAAFDESREEALDTADVEKETLENFITSGKL